MMVKVAVVLVLFSMVSAQHELLHNSGFETPLSGHWESNGFTISLSSDAHSGSHSLKSSGRMKSHYLGPSQLLNLKPGKMYKFSSYLKQLNDMPGKLFQKYRANVRFVWSNDSHPWTQYVAYQTTIRSSDGWFRMTAYFRTPTRDFVTATLHFQGPDISIDFLLDDCSIVAVSDLHQWSQQADHRIQQLRMGDIHFRFNLSPGINADEIDVQIDHTKHLFGFGTLIRDQWMTDSNYKAYQDTVYRLFNVATTQGVKWRFDKGTQGHPNFDQAIAAIDALRQHGMLVRAHNMFWGIAMYLPQYVLHMSPAQVNSSVYERLHYLVNITKGKADHWDVMNELIHGQWFEEKTHDADYSQQLYREVHHLDRKPLLMLNDYAVIARPEICDAFLQQAQKFLSQGVPLQGLGVQSHFHTAVPDPTQMMLLLDHLAQAGLPLWVTELDVWQEDPDVRADYYETVLRVYFSHPAVNGIVLWGFWDQHVVDKRSSLFDGAHLTINAAGQRFIHLMKEEWSTHTNHSLSSGTHFDLRGFKGDYEVTVRRNGVKVKVVPFSLNGNETTVDIDIDSVLDIPPPGFIVQNRKDINGNFVMGHSSSSSSSSSGSSLTCHSYYGRQSGTGAGEVAEARCHYHDEVMTGCSSVHKNHDFHRQGEQILTDSGHAVCRGVNGVGTAGAVQAIAVCCRLSGLTCAYRAAGPSPPGQGATVAARCLHNETPMGCSSWGSHNNGGGVKSANNSCTATNNDLTTGVYSYAACCSAPQPLSCITVTSQAMQGSFTHVECPPGYSLSGCNYSSEGGAKAGGSTVNGSRICQAYAAGSLASGQDLLAVATCCKAS